MGCSVRGKRWCERCAEGLWFGAWQASMRQVLLQKPDWMDVGVTLDFRIIENEA